MRSRFLAQSEVFTFLAMFFLLGVLLVEGENERIEKARLEIERLRIEAEDARKEAEAARRRYPPIVILAESEEGFRFELGSADLSPPFLNFLKSQVAPYLDEESKICECDTIEVVGHTDETRVVSRSRRHSVLDEDLIEALASGNTARLKAGSNIDLGMLRALEIVRVLKGRQQAGQLSQIRFFLPYSAGQIILNDRRLATTTAYQEDPARRRIEIRLLRSTIQHTGKLP